MTTPHRALAQIVDTVQPRAMLVCGTVAEEVSRHWQLHNSEVQITTLSEASLDNAFPLPSTQDLALVTGVVEHLPKEQGEILLGQLRNYGTHQIAVVAGPGEDWGFTDFIALGFRRQAELGEVNNPLTLYTYNIDSYNHKRAWNNPDNWANPEMWDKAWW